MRVATSSQMRELDRKAITEFGVPSLQLMECAAKGITAEVMKLLNGVQAPRAVVVCGAGNNGGDGIAAARLLREHGVLVDCCLVGSRAKLTPDAAAMEERLLASGGVLIDFDPADQQMKERFFHADVLVDAIFGIGLHRALSGDSAAAVEWMNRSPASVVAADIPSGIEADTGRVLGCAVEADVTVTFTLPKPGHYAGKGRMYAGRLVVHDIGIPPTLVEGLDTNITAIDRELVRRFLPRRPADGHKGTFGRTYILAGSVGYTGAPVFASHAAVRSGGGLVTVGVPEKIYPIVAANSREAMPYPLPDDGDGRLTEGGMLNILTRMAGCHAALLGPGLGRSGDVDALVCNLLQTVDFPVVLDADGINAVSGHIDVLIGRKASPTILTPHDGEFARLGGDLSSGDRIAEARRIAMAYGCLLILKGHCTIIALPDGELFLNPTGNSGMAKGGSGDVLAGMLVSLLGQGIHPVKAAVAAVWLHGHAGDMAAREKGEYGMTPTDLLEKIPQAILDVTGV